MKKSAIRAILIVLTFLAPTTTIKSQKKGVEFSDYNSWEEIKSAAKKENKDIFIDIYASWCAPCKKMDKETYPDSTLGLFMNKKFISIKLKLDTSQNDSESTRKKYAILALIQKKQKIKSIPTYLFFDSAGAFMHREEGFVNPDSLLSICQTAQNPILNFASFASRYKNKLLKGKDLLNYAIRLTQYQEDSLATVVAREYKESILDKQDPKISIDQSLLSMLGHFRKLYKATDPLIRYIYLHKPYTDTTLKVKGFSEGLVDYMINRDIIQPQISDPKHTPDWQQLNKEISKHWDKETANRLILNTKIGWYTSHEEWNNVIKYQTEKIDQNQDHIGFWEAFEINNFVWDVIFKHSNDTRILNKACEYMKKLISLYPNDHAMIDTYANLLYKLGDKQNAIKTEQRALSISENNKDKNLSAIFRETLKKMTENIPTWD